MPESDIIRAIRELEYALGAYTDKKPIIEDSFTDGQKYQDIIDNILEKYGENTELQETTGTKSSYDKLIGFLRELKDPNNHTEDNLKKVDTLLIDAFFEKHRKTYEGYLYLGYDIEGYVDPLVRIFAPILPVHLPDIINGENRYNLLMEWIKAELTSIKQEEGKPLTRKTLNEAVERVRSRCSVTYKIWKDFQPKNKTEKGYKNIYITLKDKWRGTGVYFVPKTEEHNTTITTPEIDEENSIIKATRPDILEKLAQHSIPFIKRLRLKFFSPKTREPGEQELEKKTTVFRLQKKIVQDAVEQQIPLKEQEAEGRLLYQLAKELPEEEQKLAFSSLLRADIAKTLKGQRSLKTWQQVARVFEDKKDFTTSLKTAGKDLAGFITNRLVYFFAGFTTRGNLSYAEKFQDAAAQWEAEAADKLNQKKALLPTKVQAAVLRTKAFYEYTRAAKAYSNAGENGKAAAAFKRATELKETMLETLPAIATALRTKNNISLTTMDETALYTMTSTLEQSARYECSTYGGTEMAKDRYDQATYDAIKTKEEEKAKELKARAEALKTKEKAAQLNELFKNSKHVNTENHVKKILLKYKHVTYLHKYLKDLINRYLTINSNPIQSKVISKKSKPKPASHPPKQRYPLSPEEKQNAFNQLDNPKYWYQDMDLYKIYGGDLKALNLSILSKQQLEYTSGTNENTLMKDTLNEATTKNPKLCIYNLGGSHWVTFAIVNSKDEKIVLYKDSLNTPIDEYLKKALIKQDIKEDNIYVHKKAEQTGDGSHCGIFAMENIFRIREGLQKNTQTFINNFKEATFCSLKDAKDFRKKKYAELYFKGVVKSMLEANLNPSTLEEWVTELVDRLEINKYSSKMVKDRFVECFQAARGEGKIPGDAAAAAADTAIREALNNHLNELEEKKKPKAKVKKKKITIVEETQDANSLFRAIARQVYGHPDAIFHSTKNNTKKAYHLVVKERCYAHIKNHKERFLAGIREVSNDYTKEAFDEHLKNMNNPTEYEHLCMIMAIEEVYGRRVAIYTKKDGNIELKKTNRDGTAGLPQAAIQDKNPIRVRLQNGHYDSVALNGSNVPCFIRKERNQILNHRIQVFELQQKKEAILISFVTKTNPSMSPEETQRSSTGYRAIKRSCMG